MGQSSKERYNWLKKHDICVMCGQENAIKNQTLCLLCRDKSRESNKKWQKNHAEKYKSYNKEAQKKRYDFRRENGLCWICGKPTDGKVYCKYHAVKNNIKQNEKNHRTNTFPRVLLGGKGEFCYYCGKPVSKYGDKLCCSCYDREIKLMENARKNIVKEDQKWRKY